MSLFFKEDWEKWMVFGILIGEELEITHRGEVDKPLKYTTN